MGDCRHGQEGVLAPPPSGNIVVFLCTRSYSKLLSKRIIYALVSQSVISF